MTNKKIALKNIFTEHGWSIVILTFLFFLLLSIWMPESKVPPGIGTPVNKTASKDGNVEALKAIRTEKKVKEAIIVAGTNVFYVSVIDDGTRRDGYASYLCEILREKGQC